MNESVTNLVLINLCSITFSQIHFFSNIILENVTKLLNPQKLMVKLRFKSKPCVSMNEITFKN